jgi:hypothetical protein
MNMRNKVLAGVLGILAAAAFAPVTNATTLPFSTNDLQLQVNTTTGDVQLTTILTSGLAISGYEIDSTSGSLLPNNLSSISSKDSAFFVLGQTSTTIAEGSLSSTYTVNPSFDLGKIFNINGTRDLQLQWGDTNSNSYVNSPVNYVSVPEPATIALFALSGLGILTLGRKRKQA